MKATGSGFAAIAWRLALLITMVFCCTAQPAPAGEDAAVTLLRDLQQHLGSLTDFRTSFTQRLHTPHSVNEREESGVLYVMMPGRMRWNYLDPERKEFICDGRKIWFYEPEENAVTIYSAAIIGESGTPLQLLFGQGDLLRDFLVTADDTPVQAESPEGVMALVRPREEDAAFVQAHLEMVAKPVPRLVRLIVVDPLRNSTEYRFSDFRENTGLSVDYFSFEPPPGTEVWEEQEKTPETPASGAPANSN